MAQTNPPFLTGVPELLVLHFELDLVYLELVYEPLEIRLSGSGWLVLLELLLGALPERRPGALLCLGHGFFSG